MFAEALNVFAPAVEGKFGNGSSWEEEQEHTQPGKQLFGIGWVYTMG